nr:MAG TPA: hypothetical protein [Caudoviricetes sp.]
MCNKPPRGIRPLGWLFCVVSNIILVRIVPLMKNAQKSPYFNVGMDRAVL